MKFQKTEEDSTYSLIYVMKSKKIPLKEVSQFPLTLFQTCDHHLTQEEALYHSYA